MIRKLLATRSRRILVTALLAAFVGTGLYAFRPAEAIDIEDGLATFVQGERVGGDVPESLLDRIEELAKTDQIALLEMCLENSRQYRDYTVTFVKQERINGRMLPKQVVKASFRREPFSVAMAWQTHDDAGVELTVPKGDRALFIEGQYNDHIVIRPSGEILQALVGSVTRDPLDAEVMRSNLRPITGFGFERSLQNLIDTYRQAQDAGDLQFSFLGYADVTGRSTIVLERLLPPTSDYPAAKTRIFIDLESLVPVLVEGYDWDGEKFCYYLFNDIQFNMDLPDEAFTPGALDINR